MKKIFIIILAMFLLTACGTKDENKPLDNTNETNQKEEPKKEEQQNQTQENTYVDDDETIDLEEDDDNSYNNNERVIVENVINCDGCVFAYFSGEGENAKRLGDTLNTEEYTTDINNIRTTGNKQRHNFFGLVLSGNTISKAYACILKDNNIYCIQGSTDGTYHTNNIGILNQIFKADQCRTISDGNTYTCTDGSYNGDSRTSGYTSLHYETSCTIYGANSNTGKLICH